MTARRRAGPVERAVRRDVKALTVPEDPGMFASYVQLVYVLARKLDCADEEAPAAAVARLSQELRVTLRTLVEVSRGTEDDEATALPTPAWHGEDPGSSDAGPSGGGGGLAAG